MPRLPGYDLTGVSQHAIQHGNNRQPEFFAVEDYERYREDLAAVARPHGCAIHACVLMTNHVHLLMTPLRAGASPRTTQSLGRCCVACVNRAYRRTGALWEGRYMACLVQSERYLLTCHHYIEDSPVRAGMVEHPGCAPIPAAKRMPVAIVTPSFKLIGYMSRSAVRPRGDKRRIAKVRRK